MHRRLSGVGGKPPIHRSCAKPRSIGRTPTPVRMNAGFSCTGPRGLDRLMEILGCEGLGSVLHRAQAVES